MIAIIVITLLGAGLAWCGGQGGVALLDVPVMGWAVGLAFLLQWLAFMPAFIAQTERYYDLTGSLTYISVTLLALALAGTSGDARSVLLTACVLLWAARLGVFLFRRILADGSDSRFDNIKPSAVLFLRTWTLQGLWVAVTAGAALAAITSGSAVRLTVLDGFAFALWLLGLGVEAVADAQKRRHRQQHGSEGFITTGLWRYSRHPNYFGEIVLWCGVALLALPALSGWQYVTLVSPVFVFLLLTRVSGVPLLERKADKRWGDDPDYIAYRDSTPVLVPFFGRRGAA